MCNTEMCPCRSDVCLTPEAWFDFWDAVFPLKEELEIYQDPAVRARLDEIGWNVV